MIPALNEGETRSGVAGMTVEQMEKANRARLRRDYREASPEQRVKQVAELSRQLSSPTVHPRDH